MVVKVLLCLFVLVAAAVGITDEQYYSMPRMFELDDYDECLGSRGAFCLGSFHLSSQKYSKLLDIIQEISKDKYKFNHTVISRGYCVTTTCAHVSGEFLPEVFEDCVQNITKSRYKLDARLLTLEYCQTRNSPPQTPVDVYDMIFACVAGLILIGNAVGTAYDLLRNPDAKPNRYLMSWSLIENWKRLTATYEKGDPRYEPLTPVHGLKAITLILVMLAHSVIAHHMTYIHNPRFLEEKNIHPLSTVLHNGTSVVQTFIILSSFLLGYNVLHSLETDPKKKVNFRLWFTMVVHRIARILPLNVFVVGLSATWWRFASAGPLWALVRAESARCRRKWWAHALFVNNLVEPDDRCLVQSWFLAVDMQLYILMSLVLVLLARRKHAVKILAGLFVATVVANFFIAYYLDLKSILFIAYPEYIRAQYFGVPSFKWQYAAAWGSAPAAALGLLLAALQRRAGHTLQGSAVRLMSYTRYLRAQYARPAARRAAAPRRPHAAGERRTSHVVYQVPPRAVRSACCSPRCSAAPATRCRGAPYVSCRIPGTSARSTLGLLLAAPPDTRCRGAPYVSCRIPGTSARSTLGLLLAAPPDTRCRGAPYVSCRIPGTSARSTLGLLLAAPPDTRCRGAPYVSCRIPGTSARSTLGLLLAALQRRAGHALQGSAVRLMSYTSTLGLLLATPPDTRCRGAPYVSCRIPGTSARSTLGLLLAALQRRAGHALQGSAVFRVFYWLSVPANLLWILGGYFIRDSNSRFTVALYTALDRPVFCLLMSVTMIGLFFKVDRLYRHILTWRAWQILGRMSLSVLLVHWSYNLTILAVKTNLARVSVYEIGGHLFASMFMTYVTSLPLYLMVEIPAQKTLQMLFSP
ncbi:uncharacterized protein LOC123663308 [Melitaea cinxia]|uniref:uncharacterized protein LOC123663308 n=1 Tax=Melitaea cinxia TaxID=113334 RepID=UPI001E26FAE4|nr:uncharacterized protein LOC123663308 [Melitaea cinxia]